jgi:predicted pyridoxine 5'-phosphate oxidase superfamily flavin-nucleotide-binding protein
MGAFHEGEQALQERAGVRERFAHAAFIRDAMPQQHRDFFELLPFVLVGSVDAQGQPCASVLAGPPGFMVSPDEKTLAVVSLPGPHDPLAANLSEGAPLGLLGLQPHTRRRNRLNGHVAALADDGFAVRVDQSFGNCPKYIQAREPRYATDAPPASHVATMEMLDPQAQALVRNADTFFIASAHPLAARAQASEQGIDVSHRGGRPGFVRVDEGRLLTVPDFTGNSFFNTLGNLLLEPRCGLLFVDYDSGATLQVAGRAEIIAEGDELASFRGALRLLRIEVTRAVRVENALPLRWGPAQPSPVLENTGAW